MWAGTGLSCWQKRERLVDGVSAVPTGKEVKESRRGEEMQLGSEKWLGGGVQGSGRAEMAASAASASYPPFCT